MPRQAPPWLTKNKLLSHVVETDAGCGTSAKRQQTDKSSRRLVSDARLAAICEQGRCSGTLHLGPVRFDYCRPGIDLQGSTIHTRATCILPELQHRMQRPDWVVTRSYRILQAAISPKVSYFEAHSSRSCSSLRRFLLSYLT
jgi:hypothetical protein